MKGDKYLCCNGSEFDTHITFPEYMASIVLGQWGTSIVFV